MNYNYVFLAAIVLVVGAVFYFFSTYQSLNSNSQPLPGDLMSKDEGAAAMKQKDLLYPKVPELSGISGYLNTDGKPIKISDFRGKVVLVDFWTYTCINCIRTLPHIVDWDSKYRDQGLVIIGVHTPEFDFEKDKSNVQSSLEKYGIQYPVVQDNDYQTWKAFQNQYWPHKYLIDKDGYIRYDHIGEGGYDETERQIQNLLKEVNPALSTPSTSTIPDTTPTQVRTPELYAGYEFALPRGENIGNPEGLQPEQTIAYSLPSPVPSNVIVLAGKWKSNAGNLQSQDDALSKLVLNFSAGSVNVVAESPSSPIRVEVKINGEYISKAEAGKDVQFDGNVSFATIDSARLYNVFAGSPDSYILELSTSSMEFKISAFTFGD